MEEKSGLLHGIMAVAISLIGGSIYALSVVTDGAVGSDWFYYEYSRNFVLAFIFGGISFSSFIGMMFSIGGILSMIKNQVKSKLIWFLNCIVPLLLIVSFVLYKVYDSALPRV